MNVLTPAQRNSKYEFDHTNGKVSQEDSSPNPHKDLRTVMLTKAVRDFISADKELRESFFLRAKVLPVTSSGLSGGSVAKKGYKVKVEFARFDEHYYPQTQNWLDLLTGGEHKELFRYRNWSANRLRPTLDFYGGSVSKKGMITSVRRGFDSNIREASEASYILFLYNTLIKDEGFGEKIDKKMMKMNPYCFPGMGEGWRRAGSYSQPKKYVIVNGDWPDHDEGEYPSLKTVYLFARAAAYRRLKQIGWKRAGRKPGEYIWRAGWREESYFAENPSVVLNHIPLDMVLRAKQDWENWGKTGSATNMKDRPRNTEMFRYLSDQDNIQTLLGRAFENPNQRREYVSELE